MAIKISSVPNANAGRIYTVAIPVKNEEGVPTGESMHVKYRAITTENMEVMRTMTIAEQLALLVTDLDLVDDDEQPIVPSAELLRTLPVSFLSELQQAITDDFFPK